MEPITSYITTLILILIPLFIGFNLGRRLAYRDLEENYPLRDSQRKSAADKTSPVIPSRPI